MVKMPGGNKIFEISVIHTHGSIVASRVLLKVGKNTVCGEI